jgi:Protein of unknown function (DUF2723)
MPSLPAVAEAHPEQERSIPASTPAPQDRLVTAAIVAVTLAVYIRSLMPGIGFSGDAAKWQTLSEVGGVPHATGYPLYVALIQAFGSVLPVGSPAWHTNLFSALCGAAAVAVLYRLLRLLDVRWGVAAATALTFAFTKAFWTQAVIAEVYTLHVLFLVSILACVARWRLGGHDRWLLAALALLALSFGNHLTTVLVVPGVVWLLSSDWRRALTPRHVLWATAAAVVAAAQYLYLLYMTDVGGYVETPVHDLGDIWATATGGYFQDKMFAFTPAELVRDRVPMLWRFLREEYGVLLVPAAYGVMRGLQGAGEPRSRSRARRDIAIAVALLGVGSAIYGLNFDVVDVIVFFLPLFLALAVFLGLGLEGIVDWITARFPASRAASLVVAGALVAIPLITGLVDYRRASQRGTTADHDRIEQALDAVGDHAVILTDNYDDSEFFWYFLLAEGVGEARDLALVHSATPEQVEGYLAGRPGVVAGTASQVRGTDDPPLLTTSRSQADAMADAGLGVTEYAPGVWQVDRHPPG